MRAFFTTLALLLTQGGGAAATVYEIDAAESEILIRTDRGGLFGFAGHRHTIHAQRFDGRIEWDDAAEAPTALTVRIDATSLRVKDADLSDSDRAKVQSTMETDVLEVADHPEITFTSDEIAVEGEAWRAKGTLALHGTERETEIRMTATRWRDLLQLAGTFEVRQKDHGMNPVSIGLGAVKVKDEVQIELRVEARAVREPVAGEGAVPAPDTDLPSAPPGPR